MIYQLIHPKKLLPFATVKIANMVELGHFIVFKDVKYTVIGVDKNELTIMRINKKITLHPNRTEIANRLREKDCSMLAYIIETGLSLAGYNETQEYYDECVSSAMAD